MKFLPSYLYEIVSQEDMDKVKFGVMKGRLRIGDIAINVHAPTTWEVLFASSGVEEKDKNKYSLYCLVGHNENGIYLLPHYYFLALPFETKIQIDLPPDTIFYLLRGRFIQLKTPLRTYLVSDPAIAGWGSTYGV